MKISMIVALVSLAGSLGACGESRDIEARAAVSAAPVEVGVITLKPERVAITMNLPGRTSPYRVAEVRPQVGGVIEKRLFEEGSEVEAGQVLYQIDPTSYQAALESAHATLAQAKANAPSLRSKVKRYNALTDAVAEQDRDDAIAALAAAEAEIAFQTAEVKSARINLDYTLVKSPISGRIGRSYVTEGALATANQETALATVQQLDPIYVDVTQASAELIRLKRLLASGKLQGAGPGQASARLFLEDGSEYPERGTLQFSEVVVDPGTGSVTLRAVFPNPENLLLPGMFVHAELETGVDDRALLVPQAGVSRNQRGEPTVLVVNSDNKVELRPIRTERSIGNKWLVTEGLKAGDKVIVQGLQKALPGMSVRIIEAPVTAAADPARP